MDPRARRYYAAADESRRLWDTPLGTLTRLRTWDILDRVLPARGRVADIGGGPGVHAQYLAGRGHDVTLVDPVEAHVATAAGLGLDAHVGDARALPLPDAAYDAVLLLGPLYHLIEAADRAAALAEAQRVLRPGGVLIAEAITRTGWILDATAQGRLADDRIWADFDLNLRTGLSHDPDTVTPGNFFGYFHRPDDLAAEVTAGGFVGLRLISVESFAQSLGNLVDLLAEPTDLLRALRLVESEPTLLSAGAHVQVVAHRRDDDGTV